MDDPRGPANDVSYTYDTLGRRISTRATNLSGAIGATYNARGERLTLTDATGTTTFTPDALGHITQVAAPTGNVTYGYNALSQRTHLGYPNSTTIDYTYTPNGQMDLVKQGMTILADYGYDLAGRLGTLVRSNGATTTYGYDGADQLHTLQTLVGTTQRHALNYTLNRRGERLSLSETTAQGTADNELSV